MVKIQARIVMAWEAIAYICNDHGKNDSLFYLESKMCNRKRKHLSQKKKIYLSNFLGVSSMAFDLTNWEAH